MRILVIDQAPRTAKSQPPYDVAAIEALLNGYASPGTKVEIGFPDDFAGSNVFLTIGAQSALNGLHHMMETPAIVWKIFWAAESGYDAVISSNTFEPGVDGGRLAVDIPVIGLMRTAMHAAATLADRIGITVPLPPHVPYTWRLLRTHGLDRFVSDIRPIGIYGQDHPGAGRGDAGRDHRAAGRRADPLRGRPEGSRRGDRRAGPQHQGDRHPFRGNVRGLRDDAERADLSAGETKLRRFPEMTGATPP
jgi:hypothetical protein